MTPYVLRGWWFHSFEDNGRVKWQGSIEEELCDGWYLVQLYSWLAGDPSCCKVVHISAMAGWSFYRTSELMNDAYERLYR